MNIYIFLHYIEEELYYWQQHLNELSVYQVNHFTISAFLLVFISGILTSLNPCNMSILPIAICTSYQKTSQRKLYKSYEIITGLLISIIITVILTIISSIYYQRISNHITILSSLYTIFMGLNLLNITEFNYTGNNQEHSRIIHYSKSSRIQNYTVGFLIGLNTLSCSTPLLIYIMYWITKSQLIALGCLYTSLYIIGYSIPLLLFIKLADTYIELINKSQLRKYSISIIGSLTLSIGIFLLLTNIYI